jgi:hypothetical protein
MEATFKRYKDYDTTGAFADMLSGTRRQKTDDKNKVWLTLAQYIAGQVDKLKSSTTKMEALMLYFFWNKKMFAAAFDKHPIAYFRSYLHPTGNKKGSKGTDFSADFSSDYKDNDSEKKVVMNRVEELSMDKAAWSKLLCWVPALNFYVAKLKQDATYTPDMNDFMDLKESQFRSSSMELDKVYKIATGRTATVTDTSSGFTDRYPDRYTDRFTSVVEENKRLKAEAAGLSLFGGLTWDATNSNLALLQSGDPFVVAGDQHLGQALADQLMDIHNRIINYYELALIMDRVALDTITYAIGTIKNLQIDELTERFGEIKTIVSELQRNTGADSALARDIWLANEEVSRVQKTTDEVVKLLGTDFTKALDFTGVKKSWFHR